MVCIHEVPSHLLTPILPVMLYLDMTNEGCHMCHLCQKCQNAVNYLTCVNYITFLARFLFVFVYQRYLDYFGQINENLMRIIWLMTWWTKSGRNPHHNLFICSHTKRAIFSNIRNRIKNSLDKTFKTYKFVVPSRQHRILTNFHANVFNKVTAFSNFKNFIDSNCMCLVWARPI